MNNQLNFANSLQAVAFTNNFKAAWKHREAALTHGLKFAENYDEILGSIDAFVDGFCIAFSLAAYNEIRPNELTEMHEIAQEIIDI